MTANSREMTVGADETGTVDAVDAPGLSGTGFYIALAAWIPLGLFLLLVATPPTQSGDCGYSLDRPFRRVAGRHRNDRRMGVGAALLATAP